MTTIVPGADSAPSAPHALSSPSDTSPASAAPGIASGPGPASPQAPERAGHRRRRLDLAVTPALLAAVLPVHAWNISGYPGLGDDEGTYLAQAWAVRTGRGLAHYTYWYDHPPAGWLQIAGLSWLPDRLAGASVTAHARTIMLLVTAVNVVLLYRLALRLGLTRWTAAAGVLVFALCPLSVAMQRQVYLDGFAIAWFLAALLMALSSRRHLWHHVAAGACAAMAVLSKETMAVALPALAVAFWQGSHASTRKFSLAGFFSTFALLTSVYPLYAAIKGELLPGPGHVSLFGAIRFQLGGRAGSGSVFDAGSDAGRLLNAWLYSDGILLSAGLGATVAALALAVRPRFRALLAPAVAAGLLTVMALRPGGYLPAMYVLQVLPFYALLAVGVSEYAIVAMAGGRPPGSLPPARPFPPPRRLPPWGGPRPLRWALATCCVLAASAFVLPRWYAGDRRALSADANSPYAAAARWLRTAVADPAHRRVVVDDTLWLDAVEAGFTPGTGAIWFYKLDPDPAISRVVADWKEIDYIVSSPILRQSLTGLPKVRAVLEHSRVIRTFGAGDNRVEIREVVGR